MMIVQLDDAETVFVQVPPVPGKLPFLNENGEFIRVELRPVTPFPAETFRVMLKSFFWPLTTLLKPVLLRVLRTLAVFPSNEKATDCAVAPSSKVKVGARV